MELTFAQKQIVETRKNKVVVVASAAAGKTRCITERVRWLLNNNYDPKKIVAITFTNAAAEEISIRLNNPKDVFIGTVHSLANRLLIQGGIDTTHLLKTEKFDDLFPLIEEFPECIPEIEHLIVDEAQDSNNLQFSFFLDILKPKNYMLVGDHRQSIYRFASSNPDFLVELMDEPGVTTYDLNENFRNGYKILDYARSLIAPLGYKYRDESVAMRNFSGEVLTVECSYHGIAKTIQRRIKNGEDIYNDWFILTRTNRELDEVRIVLNKYGIPNDTFKRAFLDNKGLEEKMQENSVKVITIHTSKGLEAKNVIVIGANFLDVEERCLSYVAATRARDLLVWTYRRNRPIFTRKAPQIETCNWE